MLFLTYRPATGAHGTRSSPGAAANAAVDPTAIERSARAAMKNLVKIVKTKTATTQVKKPAVPENLTQSQT